MGRPIIILLLLLLPGMAFAASSNVTASSHDSVSLISRENSANQGNITLALRFELAPGWHIYWSNPGDAGFPPQVSLAPPASAGPMVFPPPEYYQQGPVAAYVLSGQVVLPFPAHGVGNTVTAHANWLVCSATCVPEQANFRLVLPGGSSAEAALFDAPPVMAFPFAAHITAHGALFLAGLTPQQVRAARFFPDQQDAIVNSAPQPLTFSSAGLTLRLKPGPGFDSGRPLSGVVELTDPGGTMQALRVNADPGPGASAPSLVVWLSLAFLGGLILNLMPCVFPVLAMKAVALSRMSRAHANDIRREAVNYTAGVLVAMMALGGALWCLRRLGSAAGWGFQFQSPVFIALIAWIILTVGLNLAGAFEVLLPSPVARRLGHGGSFFTGLFVVALATPCTAPFMGGAIAAALMAPLPAALPIFLCLGLGLSAPFVLAAVVPPVARLMPRPGLWMVILQRVLSIPMFASFLWLTWVMRQEAGLKGTLLLVAGAAILALALSVKKLRPVALLSLLLLPFLHHSQATAALSLQGAKPYSAARLAALRANHKPVFVDLTAAWCITCLVNEHATLATDAVRDGFIARHVQVLVGDWTGRDPAITQLLHENGRAGVPLYLYYPPEGEPVRLPQILTPRIVLNTIGK